MKNCTITDHLQEYREFYSIPKNLDRRKSWIEALQLTDDEPKIKHIYVCDRHFTANDFATSGLKRNAVPSKEIQIFVPEIVDSNVTVKLEIDAEMEEYQMQEVYQATSDLSVQEVSNVSLKFCSLSQISNKLSICRNLKYLKFAEFV